MAYADPTDVRVVLSPGGDDTDVGSAAYLSDDDIEVAISDASDEVNAKLAERYTVPFADPTPDLVKKIVARIAAYLATLTARRGDPIENGDPVLLGYQRAEMLLGQLQSGAAQLAGDTTPDPSPTGTTAVANMLDGSYFDVCDFPTGPFEPRWPGRNPTFL